MIKRQLEDLILKRLDYKKAILLLGPRQVGKTTLIKKIATDLDPHFLYINGDDPAIQLSWSTPNQQFILRQIGDKKIVVIDEAQRLKNIGLSAKMITDAQLGIQLFITGSSALDLSSEIKEPLTGRKWEYFLYPFSWAELSRHFSSYQEQIHLHHRLVMGSYPDVIMHESTDKVILSQLAGSYLYKDILEKGGLKRPELLLKILQALAWQLGNEVSFNELSRLVEADKNTVMNYVDLLEKAFVIFRLPPLARNLRNEISSSRKIYFYDNGIRNAIINQFSPIENRNDVGALWENYLVSERRKFLHYHEFYGQSYFWRTRESEVDYVEEIDGDFYAYEFKWNPGSRGRIPTTFTKNYPVKSTEILHRDNFMVWLEEYKY